MKGAPPPFALHPWTPHAPGQIDRFGCTSCHEGQGPATTEGQAHGTAEDAGPPLLPVSYVEAGCGRCHATQTVRDAPVLSRGRAVMDRYGCYACHSVADGRRYRSEAPPLSSEPVKTGAGWLRRWLAKPRDVDPNATMPNFQLGAREIDELSHYLLGQDVPEDLARRVQLGGRRAAGRRRERQEALRRVPLHLLPHGRGQGPGLGARALEGRLGREPRLAARLRPRSARLQSPHADAAIPLQRRGVTRRRGLHGGRVSRLRRAQGHPRAAPRQPHARRGWREDVPANTAASPATELRERAPRRSSGRTSTASATRRRPSSTSAVARTCRGR